MNRQNTDPSFADRPGREALEARYGLRVAALLNAHAQDLPHDVSERLRFARERAVERAHQRVPRAAVAVTSAGRGVLALGGEPGWGWRLASLLPVLALAAGLVLIQLQHDDEQIQVAAEIDAALLADNLPPAAYSDAGFAEFLRSPGGGGNGN